VQYLKEEQDIRNSAIAVAQSDELAPAFNLNINQRDAIIVADIYDDAASILGPIGREAILDRLTEAKEILQRKYPMWKGTEGYVDLCTGCSPIVTLPRYVEEPIAINMGGYPLEMRNRWFEFHLNGPGSNCPPCHHWDRLGMTVTVNDPPAAQRLVAINQLSEDDGSAVHIFGYDENDQWIRSPNPDVDNEEEQWIDGFILIGRKNNTLPDPCDHKIKRITRILRDETQGYQSLLSYDDNNAASTLIGYFYPDELEPSYERIRLPQVCPWIRMRYRTRWLKFRLLTDPLNLRSRSAILDALRSIAVRDKDPQTAGAFEAMAAEAMRETEESANPSETFSFQFERNSMADQMQGQY
jgi:hypothetical protein